MWFWKAYHKITGGMGTNQTQNEPILLGDTIEQIFKKMGIDYVVHAVVKNCNCNARKQRLNKIDLRKIVPYKPNTK